MERMKFGFLYRKSLDHPTPMAFARRLEELGFDSFWAPEAPTNRGSNEDCFAVLCAAAAVTSRIALGSNVLLLPLHNPAWVAKQWATLDVISGGRTILCVGVGGEYPKQFEAFGVPKTERAIRTNEGIEVIKNLWTQETCSYQGKIFRYEGITMGPKPLQKPHPPIWVGGRPGGIEFDLAGKPHYKSKTAAIRRAAIYGDAWCPYYMTVEAYKESVAAVTEHARAIGRDISRMDWGLNIHMFMRDTYEEAIAAGAGTLRYGRDLSQRHKGYDLLGTPKDIVSRLEEYAEAGMRHVMVQNDCIPGQEDRVIRLFAEEVIPHFR